MTSLIHVNKKNTDKPSWGKRQKILIKKSEVSALVTTAVFNITIGDVGNKT